MTYQNNRVQAQYVSTGDPETVDDDPTKKSFVYGQLGNYVVIQQPGPRSEAGEGQDEEYRNKTYRYVKTDSTMTVAPYKGAVAWWADKSRFMVTTTVATTARALRAGVFQFAVTKGHACFIQTGGPATVKFVDAVAGGNPYTTAGIPCIPSATNGKADTDNVGVAPTYPALGYSIGSGNAAACTAIVDLAIPDTP